MELAPTGQVVALKFRPGHGKIYLPDLAQTVWYLPMLAIVVSFDMVFVSVQVYQCRLPPGQLRCSLRVASLE